MSRNFQTVQVEYLNSQKALTVIPTSSSVKYEILISSEFFRFTTDLEHLEF